MSGLMLHRSDLFAYQIDFINHIKDGASTFGCLEPGLGKTVSVLTALSDIIEEDRQRGHIRRALVVAPKRVAKYVWQQEAAAWSHLQHLNVRIALGTATQRMAAFSDPNADIVVTNYEYLTKFFDLYPRGQLPFYFLVMDEIDKMKAPGTDRFNKARRRVQEFEMRIGMTGTPTPESLLNIWGPVFLVASERGTDPVTGRPVFTAPLSASYERFKSNFFETDFNGYKHRPRPGTIRHVAEAISDFTFQARAKDHLDLPELNVRNVYYDLTPKAWEHYKKFERELVMYIRDGGPLIDDVHDDLDDVESAVAANGAVLKNKLRQMCSGFMYYMDAAHDRKTAWIHHGKTSAFKDLRSELLGESLLAVYGYKAEYESLKLDARLGGGVTDAQEQQVLDRWNAGELDVLGMHPASAGHGLNLHKSGARHIAFLTLPWSRGLYDQTVGRLYRMGQGRSVIVHRFVARGTVEEDVVNALESKGSVQEAVLTAIAERA